MAARMQWLDWVIFVIFLAILLGIGVYHAFAGGRQKTTAEFHMGNRQLKVIPTAMSLFVAYQSATMVLGTTAEMYFYGSQAMLMAPIGICLGAFIAERILVPWVYRMKLVSINSYLKTRFNSDAVMRLGCVIGLISGVLYMSVSMYSPSLALESATGLPLELSIPIMVVVSVAYTSMGGMKAVIWTDVFQCFIMIGGMLAVMIKGIVTVGGMTDVFDICGREGRLDWANWNLDPTERHTVWGFLLGYSTIYVYTYGLSQAAVQRYSGTKSLAQARLTLLLNIPALTIIILIASLTGLSVFAYYAMIECDPFKSKQVENGNQILTNFVMQMFSTVPGFAGMFIATLYGGALSTVSGALAGCAANCWEDLFKWKFSHWPETRKAVFNKFLVVIFGAIAAMTAFGVSSFEGPVTQVVLAFGGSMGGPMLGIFLLGGISRHGNAKGALAGGIISLIINLVLSVGSFIVKKKHPILPLLPITGCNPGNNGTIPVLLQALSNQTAPAAPPAPLVALTGFVRLFSISYVWYVTLGASLCFIIGFLVSMATRDSKAEADIDEKLLIPFGDMFTFGNLSRPIQNPKEHDTKSGISTDDESLLNEKLALKALNVMGEMIDVRESVI